MLSPEVKHINSELIREFGFLIDKPKFRIVWTADQREKRFGEYTDWDGDILIRRVTEVRDTEKYPYVKPPWWMLERRMESLSDPSIKDWNGYEPLYLFRQFDEKGNYGAFLPPHLEMAIVACKMSLVKPEKRNYDMDKSDFDAKELRSEKDIYEKISDQTSYMAHKFHHGEAIIHESSKEFKE